MKSLNQWLDLYGRDHKNPTNQKIHKICVPLIMLSVLGLIWCIPMPYSLKEANPFINFASLFSLICLVFYISLSIRAFSIMLAVSSFSLLLIYYLDSTTNLLLLSLIIFVLAWIGQFIGHKIEGQKPSFFEDLQFLLIGPLWVFKGFL